MTQPSPKFTIIIPLHDDRNLGVAAVAAWLEQRSAENHFQVVVVNSNRPRLVRRVAKLLAPGDRLVHAKSTNEAVLYNAGAQAADAKWLVFTEAHVLPVHDTVSALLKRLESIQADAANLGSAHRVRSRFSAVDAELTEREVNIMAGLGSWRRVGLRGFLIRRDVFTSLGMFSEDYHRFAETALAIHLVESGYRLEDFPDVVVEHFDTDTLGELLLAMALGRLGACRFWQAEPQLATAYFGSTIPDSAHGFVDPQVAMSLWRPLGRALLRGNWSAALRLLPWAAPKCFTAVTGWRGERFKIWLRAQRECWRYLGLLYWKHRAENPRHCQPVIDQYFQLRDRCAEIGAVWHRENVARAGSTNSVPTTLDAEALGRQGMNFFPPEIWQGATYRWSSPSAALLISVGSGEQEIILDARPTGGWLVRRPNLFLNGIAIASEQVTEDKGIVTVRLPAEARCETTPALLSWTCQPFKPAQAGLPDQRSLGVAIIQVQVRRTVAELLPAVTERAA